MYDNFVQKVVFIFLYVGSMRLWLELINAYWLTDSSVHWPAAVFGAPAAESGMAWPGTAWSQSASDKPSSCLSCGRRHLGHSCGSRGSSLCSTRCSLGWGQVTGQRAHPRSPDVPALLERNTREENIFCMHKAESCLKWVALMRADEAEQVAHMQSEML